MDETTVIDVNETPEQLPKLHSGAVNASALFRIVLGTLEVAGASAEDVLTTYAPTPSPWPIPPRLTELGQVQLSVGLGGEATSSAQLLIQTHTEARALVKKSGMGLAAYSFLASRLGWRVRNPLVFTPTEPSDEAADLFSLEYLLAIAPNRSVLTVQGDSVVRQFLGRRTGLSVLKLNKHLSPRLTAEWVSAQAFGSRGVAIYPTIDIFDRCALWAQRNMLKEDRETLKLALAWLKLCQSKSLAYDFEQELLKLEPFSAGAEDIEFAPLLYTHEALNLARDLWVQSSKGDYEAFRDFYSYLVPTYLDDDQFRRLFKTGMVLEENFSDDIRKLIDVGMLNFAGWFLKMVRKHERK